MATEWRRSFLLSYKQALLAEGKPGNSSIIAIERRMARERQQVALGRASRRITRKDYKLGIFKAECTNQEGLIVELHDQPSMVAAMTVSNRVRQQQCLGTPSMTPPFINDFGYLANTAAAKAVIEGTYVCSPDMDPYLVEFIETLPMPESVRDLDPLDVTITCEENWKAWHSQSVRIASEPTCLSFAHFKTASQHPLLNAIDTLL